MWLQKPEPVEYDTRVLVDGGMVGEILNRGGAKFFFFFFFNFNFNFNFFISSSPGAAHH